MSKKVYLLSHTYEYGEHNEYDEIKILGIYSSMPKALNARKQYMHLDGFSNYPKECFSIDEYSLDKDEYWTDGFIEY